MAALIPAGSVHEQQKWSDQLRKEYLNGNEYRAFMGAGTVSGGSMAGNGINSLIMVLDALGNKAGTKINIPLRRALTGTGVTGDQTLEGNEEEMVYDNESITIDLFRHAVIVRNPTMSEQRAAFQLFDEARPALTDWSEEKLAQEITDALVDTSRGRVQSRYRYGKVESNWNATHATALGNLDATDDLLTVALVKALKDKAKAGDPTNGVGRIRPAKMSMENGVAKKTFVLFCGTRARRNLENDTAYLNLQARNPVEAMAPKLVDTSNFIGMIDGVLCYEIERMPVSVNSGAGAAVDTSPVVLCGAQAVAVVYGQRPFFTMQEGDYGMTKGVAINEVRDVQKMVFNSANFSVVNAFVALTAA